MNADRMAHAEAAITPTHASKSCQSICQVVSSPFSPGRILPRMRKKARMIMQTESDRKAWTQNFCLLSMSDFRKMRMGNEITVYC
jgi:hypothetical protein